MEELVDIFDEDFHYLGVVLKSEAHWYGWWHQTFQCWMVRQRQNRFYILLQKRADCKEDAPDVLDISAAGHLIAGENKEDGVREIEEELGIRVDVRQLVYLGVRIAKYQTDIHVNREFCHVYLLEHDRPLHRFELQKTELKSLVEFEINDIINLFTGKKERICGWEYDPEKGLARQPFERHHFLYREDPYYLKICKVALGYFDGQKYDKKNMPWQGATCFGIDP